MAALRDFAAELHAAAEQAQDAAGDPEPDDDRGDVDMWIERFGGPGIAIEPMPTYTLPDRPPQP